MAGGGECIKSLLGIGRKLKRIEKRLTDGRTETPLPDGFVGPADTRIERKDGNRAPQTGSEARKLMLEDGLTEREGPDLGDVDFGY